MVTAPAIETLPDIPEVRVMVVPSLPAQLAGGVRLGPGLEARPGAVLISVPQIARYLASNGVAIEVAANPRAEIAVVETFLDGPARAAIIHERGELPVLSTTVVSPQGKGVVLCGLAGIGKSAIGAALTLRGWSLVAEGVTRIALDGNEAVAQPSHNALRLWQDTCALLKIDYSGLHRTRAKFAKYYVPVQAAQTPAPVSLIVKLRPDPKIFMQNKEISSRKILEDSAYKHALSAAVGKWKSSDAIMNAIVKQARFAAIEGAHAETLDDLADRVESALS